MIYNRKFNCLFFFFFFFFFGDEFQFLNINICDIIVINSDFLQYPFIFFFLQKSIIIRIDHF